MTGDPYGSVCKLRDLASSLNITGSTAEQTLLLAIIDALEELTDSSGIGTPEFLCNQQDTAMNSKCPNCGIMIQLDVSNLQSDEPIICENCNEVIGVITGSMK